MHYRKGDATPIRHDHTLEIIREMQANATNEGKQLPAKLENLTERISASIHEFKF